MTRSKTYLAHGLVAVAVLAAQGQTASAADPKGQYGVRGAALATCEIYERERTARSEVYNMIASWMDGYITGINQHSADTYDIASFESTELLAALVSENCKEHPETPVFAVVNSLVAQLAPNRLVAPSEKITVAVDDNKVRLYEEVVRRVQEKMTAAGFYRGNINGIYDSQVQEAMGAFQESIGLQPTGFPDQLTLWRLFNGGR